MAVRVTKAQKSGIATGANSGHIVTPRAYPKRSTPQVGATRVKFVRELVREVVGFAPYERRCMELLKNSMDKRAKKLVKKRLGTMRRAKRKLDELNSVLADSRRAH